MEPPCFATKETARNGWSQGSLGLEIGRHRPRSKYDVNAKQLNNVNHPEYKIAGVPLIKWLRTIRGNNHKDTYLTSHLMTFYGDIKRM